jgi:hypothetical protein
VAAIVEQNDISSADLLCAFLFDYCCRRPVPIVPSDIPHDGLKPKFLRNAQNYWPTRTKWGPEKIGVLTDRVLQGHVAARELLSNVAAAPQAQYRMSEGVIANHVSGFDQFTDQVRPLLNIAPNSKKSCAHIVLRKYVKQAQGVRIVGAVIESERDLLGAAGQPDECSAIPLSCGRHGLIAGCNECPGSRRPGEYGWEHGAIVAD